MTSSVVKVILTLSVISQIISTESLDIPKHLVPTPSGAFALKTEAPPTLFTKPMPQETSTTYEYSKPSEQPSFQSSTFPDSTSTVSMETKDSDLTTMDMISKYSSGVTKQYGMTDEGTSSTDSGESMTTIPTTATTSFPSGESSSTAFETSTKQYVTYTPSSSATSPPLTNFPTASTTSQSLTDVSTASVTSSSLTNVSTASTTSQSLTNVSTASATSQSLTNVSTASATSPSLTDVSTASTAETRTSSKPVSTPKSGTKVTLEEILALFSAIEHERYFQKLPVSDRMTVYELAAGVQSHKINEVLEHLGFEKFIKFIYNLPTKYIEQFLAFLLQGLKLEREIVH